MTTPVYDWNAIAPLNGHRDEGFEELCTQLARAEIDAGDRPVHKFVRKGRPDAGVECYVRFVDSSEWGWQAKYFLDAMGDSQFGQLDKSIRRALKEHPEMTRYYVCVPRDLSDARGGRNTEQKKWDTWENKWKSTAKEEGRELEIVFWGSSELLNLLNQSRHTGLLKFWFGQYRFDLDWFKKKCAESIDTAGPRYTPELHVDLPVAKRFDAFGCTPSSFDDVKRMANVIRERFKSVNYTSTPALEELPVWSQLDESLDDVFECFHELDHDPYSPNTLKPLRTLLEHTLARVSELHHGVQNVWGSQASRSSTVSDRHQDQMHALRRLEYSIQDVLNEIMEHDEFACASTLILDGDAGQGKTHLFCDLVERRLEQGQPTLLVMGQRLTAHTDPWTQLSQLLGVRDISLDEFVGVLEASAQMYGQKLILFIDAINEGRGKEIWPAHLEAFLAAFQHSSWVSVALSVRTPYMENLVSRTILAKACQVTHPGFAYNSYEALTTFFHYYNVEVPTTPISLPEFSNPLFLKMLCEGLRESGETRLPRGVQGITRVFTLYLNAVNTRLAQSLDYRPKTQHVHRLLRTCAREMAERGERWLPAEVVEDLSNQQLPREDFSKSLYHGLIVEGVLLEHPRTDLDDDTIRIVYERLEDDLVAQSLLGDYQELSWDDMLAQNTRLSEWLEQGRFSPGVFAALWIHVAECYQQELSDLVQNIPNDIAGEAFLTSLIWRAPDAFSDTALRCVRYNIIRGSEQVLDAVLMLATVPDHPLNIFFLHELLCSVSMPDRDAWWSTNLHHLWEERMSPYRLVEWVWSHTSEHKPEDEVIDLCALTLAWMCTCPNRRLRDRASSALVNLLTGRPDRVNHLIAQCVCIDDPYVLERVYAVAYGVLMRCVSLSEHVEPLAMSVYRHVFKDGDTPAHLLLRDYARGVIERALYLGATLDIDVTRCRPPYQSTWPHIPDEDELSEQYPGLYEHHEDKDENLRMKHRIHHSVRRGDFSRYVIGDRTHWLTHRLTDQPWERPLTRVELEEEFENHLNDDERQAWNDYKEISCSDSWILKALQKFMLRQFQDSKCPDFYSILCIKFIDVLKCVKDIKKQILVSSGMNVEEHLYDVDAPKCSSITHEQFDDYVCTVYVCQNYEQYKYEITQQHKQATRDTLWATLSDENRKRFITLDEWEHPPGPPYFDVHNIQRYVAWRVIDLGWDVELHGEFDVNVLRSDRGRVTSKPERLGKKYQWIAYYEMLAYMSDHLQYYSDENIQSDLAVTTYQGPWQLSCRRDFDPSCTLRALPGGYSETSTSSWWTTVDYSEWEKYTDLEDWVKEVSDLPGPEHVLSVNDPEGQRWWCATRLLSWKQPNPVDHQNSYQDRANLYYIITGYVIRQDDVESFLAWAEGVDFFGRWMPEETDAHEMFLGEHGWSCASDYFQDSYFSYDGWSKPEGCPVELLTPGWNYRQEDGGYNCAMDESYTLKLPSPGLMELLEMRWSGHHAEYNDTQSRVMARDPSVSEPGPNTLLVSQHALTQLEHQGYTLCWAILGEKLIVGSTREQARVRMTGAYAYGLHGIQGFIKHVLLSPGASGFDSEEKLPTYRYREE